VTALPRTSSWANLFSPLRGRTDKNVCATLWNWNSPKK
jgi:hypothetical protein